MSGHNKWSKIKNKKAVSDAKKSKVFSMHAKTITIESKKAGGDKMSPGLRAAIDRAKGVNMPSDNIERAVAKGISSDANNLEEVLYEAYGPGGVAILIEGITDSKNRTTAEIKHLLSKNNGTLGSQGSAIWAFNKVDGGWEPVTKIPLEKSDKEKLENLVEVLEDYDDTKGVFTNIEIQ